MVKELDKVVAANLKKLRAAARLTQPQVAAHLGITYQAYQKMESGAHSFRVSTLDSLAILYDVKLSSFVEGVQVLVSPSLARAIRLLRGMDVDRQEEAIRAILIVKHGGSK